MYIKFIGAAFLIVAGCMSGKEISSNYLNRLRQLEEIKKKLFLFVEKLNITIRIWIMFLQKSPKIPKNL